MQDQALDVDALECLKNHMITSLEQLKAFHLTVSALMIELSAIRRTTLITKKVKSRYEINLAKAIKKARPLLDQAVRSFDDQIDSVSRQMQSEEQQSSKMTATTLH
jgi:hypothetical protein